MIGVMALSMGFAQAKEKAAAESVKTYVIGMTGVTWGGCKKYVRGAFKNLDGIVCEDVNTDIKIAKGEKKGTQVVTIKTTKALTKEAAIAAIGAKKDRFVVKSVKEEGEDS